MGYKKDAIKGLSWASGARMVTRLFTFIKIALLARVLAPSQFGLFGIASLVLALLEVLTETGINILIVQSKQKISEYVNSAWVVSIIRGCVISLSIIILSPFIAAFFNTPESFHLLLFISIVPLVRGFINPSIALYQKELRFHAEFWFRSVVLLIDTSVAIGISLLTHSVYSLVWGMLAGAVVEVVLSFILITPRPRFSIEREYFKDIFHKGKWVTIYTVFNYFAENGDNVIVGRLMGAASLGLYQMAYKLSILPISEISEVVSRVVFPIYVKISHDKKRLLGAFLKTLGYMSLSATLLGCVIFFFPDQLITLFLGDKWLAAAPVLKVLALYGIVRTFSGPTSALFLSVGMQRYVTAMTFTRFAGLVLTIYPFVRWYGMVGAGYSALFSAVVELPVMFFFAAKVLNWYNRKQ